MAGAFDKWAESFGGGAAEPAPPEPASTTSTRPAPTPVQPIRTERALRDAAQLSPAEQAASAAFERSPGNIAELRSAIAQERNPQNRAVLQAELDKQTGGESPAPAAKAPKGKGAFDAWAEGIPEAPPPEPPKPGLMKRIGQGLADAVSTASSSTAQPEAPARPVGERRGGLRSEAKPFAADEDPTGRNAFGRTDPRRLDLPPPVLPGATVLDRPASPEQRAILDQERLQAERMDLSLAPETLARKQAQQRADAAELNRPSAKAPDLATNIGMDVRDATKNPILRGLVAGGAELGKTGIGAVRLAADLFGADEVARFAAGASRDATSVEGEATRGLNGADKVVANVTSSILASAPSLVLGVYGGPAMSGLFAQTALAEYNAGRDAKFSPGESAARAGIMGFAEVLGERFGFPEQIKLLRNLTKEMPKGQMAHFAGEMLKKEIPGEQLTTLIQSLADKIGPAALQPNMTMAQYLEAVGDTLVTTIGQTAVMGGGPALIGETKAALRNADRVSGRPTAFERNPTPSSAPAFADTLTEAPRETPAAPPAAPPPPSPLATFLTPKKADKPLPPTQARTESIGRFEELAAGFGLSPAAAARTKEAASSMPADEVPGFLARATEAFSKRGLFRKPVDDAGVASLQASIDGVMADMGQQDQAVSNIEATLQQAGALPEGVEPGVDTPAAEPTADTPIAGQPINNRWTAFAPESGTLNIPREQMPQIAAEHRGALVNFLNARGIAHQMEVVDPVTLKPTQGEFEPKKVEAIAEKPSTRSLLVSGDGHILDGHHQWLAARETGTPVRVVRLDAPIQDLLRLAHQFPSSTTAKGPKRESERASDEPIGNVAGTAELPVRAADGPGDQLDGGERAVRPVSDLREALVRPADAPDAGGGAAAVLADGRGGPDGALKPKIPGGSSLQGEPASWVIRDRETGAVVMETFDKAKVKALNTERYEAVPIQEHLAGLNSSSERKDAAAPVSAKPSAHAGATVAAAPSNKTPAAGSAATTSEKANHEKDDGTQARAATDANAQGAADAKQQRQKQGVGPRLIGSYGRTPKAATPIELRANPDGTLTPHDGKYPMVDFESGEPIVVPADATDAQAIEAIKQAGAVSSRDKFYSVATKGGAEADPAAAAKSVREQRLTGLKALLHCLTS